MNPTFIADLNGSYRLQLIVNDGTVDSTMDTVTVTASPNYAPIANAGPDKYVFTTSTVTLDGSVSSDVHSDTLTYNWSMTSSPDGSTAVLSDATIMNPTFIADINGSYVFQLIVNDGTFDSIPDSVTITAATFSDVEAHDPTFESTHFSGSENCVLCHNNIEDSNGGDVSLVKAWQGTIMANAAIDPLYLAKVASEVQRNPEHKEIIEEKCSRCHLPMANVEAGFSEDPIAMSGENNLLDPLNMHYDSAKEGVSCTLCHQIEKSAKVDEDDEFSGNFVINGSTRIIYGPYNNVNPTPMESRLQYTIQASDHIKDSKLCARCHNLNTPVISTDGQFANVDPFPEQAVYTEWEYSDFNATQSCQDCHMPVTDGVIISTQGARGVARDNFHQHKFLGANTYMLEILKNNRVKLGAVADEARFEESINDTRAFLKAAADIDISTPNFTSGTLEFSVKVTNHSGHKFPTSLPSRRAWLHVKVTNQNNETVFESGAMTDNGQIIGVDDTAGYELHHNIIDNNNSVQVYEPIMADTNGNQTYTFMNAASYIKDNRILPKGFDKHNVPSEASPALPYGLAMNDNDFIGGSDTVTYAVSNLDNDGEYTITVTLKYQTASYGFMQDLYKDINLTEVALIKVLDDNTEYHFETISTDSASIK